MRKKVILLSIVVIFIVALVVIFTNFNNYKFYDVSSEEVNESYDFLYKSLDENRKKKTYYDYLKDVNVAYGDLIYDATPLGVNSPEKYGYKNNNVNKISYKESVSYDVNISKAGYYNIVVDYYVVGTPLTNYDIKLAVNDEYQFSESEHISVPILWQDETKDFPLDSYGDETPPQSIKKDVWAKLNIYDNKYSTSTPLLYYFQKGINTVKITMLSSNGDLALGDMKINQPTSIADYTTYKANFNNISTKSSIIDIDAIDYIEKNSSFVRMMNLNNPLAKPFDNSKKMLNIIDGGSWKKAGQELTYSFNVENAGLYNLGFYYRNNKNEYNVFRSIYIDGAIPFKECLAYELPETGSKYVYHTLQANESKYEFYLSKGTHTLSLKAEVSPLLEPITKLQLVIDHINQLALEVLKITGAEIDADRTWDITKYIPDTEKYLQSYDTILKGIVNQLAQFSSKGTKSSSIAYINRAIKYLADLMKRPGELPLHLPKLYTGTSSINSLLGDVLDGIASQPVYLESMVVSSIDKNVKVNNANFFKKLGSNISQLWQTFFSDKYRSKIDDSVINVWVNRPITYIDAMQKMIDSDFNQKSPIKVKLSAMPDQSKLTLAVAANNAPDVVLGVQSHIPYDLAIRNGVYNLANFDDFWSVASRFAPGSLVSFVVSDANGDRVYALPETLDFNVLAYRSDIFNSLDINTDLQTWDDIIAILPILQRYGMNFYLPIAADNATKWFYQTTPMLLQAGGSLYAPDGLSVAINSNKAINGLELLTSMFTEKSLPTMIPKFYSQFRNGSLPVGVLDLSTYLMLKNAAPEITGKWEIAPPLGTKVTDDSGREYIDRTYISAGTSAAIMETSKYKKDSWEFIKWWTSETVQSRFAYNLQSTYGPEYLWLSSNIEAVKDSQIETKDKEVILKSVNWISDVVRNPGQYMVERGLSNIWTATVLTDNVLRVEIQNQVITMNREITKKMQEFGYVDEHGNKLIDFYVRDINWIKKMIEERGGKK